MTKRTSKRVRLAVTVASVIAVAMMFPMAAFASESVRPNHSYGAPSIDGNNLGSIVLEKNCADGFGILDASQCSFNVAAPEGKLYVDQWSVTKNESDLDQDQDQKQVSVQKAFAPATNVAFQGGLQVPIAAVVTFSGPAIASGHEAKVIMPHVEQEADAGNEGHLSVSSQTGPANTEVSGDVKGGIANTGIAQKGEAEIKGGYAKAEVEGDAGGNGGDGDDAYANGGDQYKAGNAWALSATLGCSEADGCCNRENDFDRFGGFDGGDECCPGNTTSGVNGGDANATGGSPKAGDGGTATGGAGGNGGNGANIAFAKNVGDNANAQQWNTATSGDANVGPTYGHEVVGGNSGMNTTSGAMVGGTASNVLGVQINQGGNVAATSGTPTNYGTATASAGNWLNQYATPTVNQSQDPYQKGLQAAGVKQDASSTQTSDPTQTVSTGSQWAKGSAESEVEVKVERGFPTNYR